MASRFKPKSDSLLYLVLDGVDEADGGAICKFTELPGQIRTEELNIHGDFHRPVVNCLKPLVIEVMRKKVYADMQQLVDVSLRRLFRIHSERRLFLSYGEKADCEIYSLQAGS